MCEEREGSRRGMRGRVRGEEEWREWESKRGGVGGKRKGRGHLMYRSWCYLNVTQWCVSKPEDGKFGHFP